MTSGKAPVRYEWTVGVAGESKGGKLIDQSQPLWRETGSSNTAFYTTRSSQKSGKCCISVDYCMRFTDILVLY